MARLSEARSRHQAYVSATNHGNSQFRPPNLLLQVFQSRFESEPCKQYIANWRTARAAFSFLEYRRQSERSAVTANSLTASRASRPICALLNGPSTWNPMRPGSTPQ